MTELNIPSITVHDGAKIPQLGLGVFKVETNETERIVLEAFETGYRHIDTASYYENEAEVGAAVAKSGIDRDDIFVTTKLWNSDQGRPYEAFNESLDKLGFDAVDLYLIHWPQPMFGEALGAWKALIDIAESGRAKSIGVSNFEIEHLEEIISETGVVPVVNQIELHPLHQRKELVEFCAKHDIKVESWGPLSQGKSDLLERPTLREIADAHGKTPAQVVLRWHVQQDRIIFPKTSRPERMIENAQLFDFELSAAEIAVIDAMDEQRNFGADPRTAAFR